MEGAVSASGVPIAALAEMRQNMRVFANQWIIRSNGTDYRVIYDPAQGAQNAKCTCTWYLNHQNMRGPCKHILAVQLREENA